MEDERTDAPTFDLTPPADGLDGADALQLGPADLPADAASVDGDAFAMRTTAPKPAAASHTPPAKASKPVTAEANASVVAALMGMPVAKSKTAEPKTKLAEEKAKPAEAARPIETATAATPPAPATAEHVGPVFEVSQTDVADSLIALPSQPEVVTTESAAEVRPIAIAPVQTAAPAAVVPIVPKPQGPRPKASPAAAPKAVAKPPAAKPVPPPARPARPAVPVAPVWDDSSGLAEAVFSPKAQAPSPKARLETPIEAADPPPPAGPTGAWWTIPLTFVGIAIVACAMLIPAADETRRDAYELAKIEQDVAHFEKQSAVNADFLERVNTDPTLAERLAMRQLHQTRPGVKLAPLGGPPDRFGASPYALTRIDPPAPLPPYQPIRDPLADWFRGDPKPQQMAALGLLLAGAGVLLAGGRRRPAAD